AVDAGLEHVAGVAGRHARAAAEPDANEMMLRLHRPGLRLRARGDKGRESERSERAGELQTHGSSGEAGIDLVGRSLAPTIDNEHHWRITQVSFPAAFE